MVVSWTCRQAAGGGHGSKGARLVLAQPASSAHNCGDGPGICVHGSGLALQALAKGRWG